MTTRCCAAGPARLPAVVFLLGVLVAVAQDCRPSAECNRTLSDGGCPGMLCDVRNTVFEVVDGSGGNDTADDCIRSCGEARGWCRFIAVGAGRCYLFEFCLSTVPASGLHSYAMPDARPRCSDTGGLVSNGTSSTGSSGVKKPWPLWQDYATLRALFHKWSLPWMDPVGTPTTDIICSNAPLIECEADKRGYTLNLDSRGLSGTAPAELGMLRHVVAIRLCCQGLEKLPDSVWQMKQLKRLDLYSNNLTGELPADVGNLENLQILQVDRNRLTGPLPSSLRKLRKLKQLDLKFNSFSGELGDWFCEMQALNDVDLEENKFEGKLPDCIDKLPKMNEFDIKNNNFSGPLPQNMSAWTSLSKFEASGNKLSGTLPDVFDKLPAMRFWLDRNSFAAPIPQSLVDRMKSPSVSITLDLKVWGCDVGHEPPPPELWRQGDADKCRPCKQGHSRDFAASDSCVACPPGTIGPGAGLRQCQLCDSGSFANGTGMSECGICPVGSECEVGAAEANQCKLGSFSSQERSRTCTLCPVGSLADAPGASLCRLCGFGQTTLIQGASRPAACICEAGFYTAASGFCERCPFAMRCAVGSDIGNMLGAAGGNGSFPVPQPGFMTRASEPLKVWRCHPASVCPGGGIAVCGASRQPDRVACGGCVFMTFEVGDTCHSCLEGKSVSPVLYIVIIFFAIAFILVTLAASRPSYTVQRRNLALMAVAVQMLTSFQTMGIFLKTKLYWGPPFDGMMEELSVVAFDLKALRLGCHMNLDDAGLAIYIVRQLLPVFVLPVIGVILLLQRRLWNRNLNVVRGFTNSAGSVWSALLISLVMSSTLPFLCYRHPSGSDASMISNPGVLCWEGGEHDSLILIGALSFSLIPLPFLSLCSFATVKFPQWSARDRSHQLAMTRFLFVRFHPHCYFYGMISHARNTLLCISPILAQGAEVQVFLISFILILSTNCQLFLKPWRSTSSNVMDSALNGCLLLLLIGSTMATDKLEFTLGTLKVVMVVAFSTLMVCGSGGAIYMFAITLLRRGHRYELFICHSKKDAQAQARLLKMRFVAETGKAVFIDSDNLVDLDGLFDVVKTEIRTLLALLTTSILRRPWCAGEISTALLTNKSVVKWKALSFVPPSEDEFADLMSYVDGSGCRLIDYGISFVDVENAFRILLSDRVETLIMETAGTFKGRFDQLLDQLLTNVAGRQLGAGRSSMTAEKPIDGSIIFSCDHRSDEACAAAIILRSKLGYQLTNVLCVGTFLDTDLAVGVGDVVMNALAVVVLLSTSTLSCSRQLQVIVAAVDLAKLGCVEGQRTSMVEGCPKTSLVASVAAAVDLAKLGCMEPRRSVEGSPNMNLAAWRANFKGSRALPALVPVALPDFCFPSLESLSNTLSESCSETDLPRMAQAMQTLTKQIAIQFPVHASDVLLELQAEVVLKRLHVSKRGSPVIREKRGDPEESAMDAYQGVGSYTL